MHSVYIVKSKRHHETIYYTDKVFSTFEKAEEYIKSTYNNVTNTLKGYSVYTGYNKESGKQVALQICRSVVDE